MLNTPTLTLLKSREVAITQGLVSRSSAMVTLGFEPVLKAFKAVSV